MDKIHHGVTFHSLGLDQPYSIATGHGHCQALAPLAYVYVYVYYYNTNQNNGTSGFGCRFALPT